MDLLVCHLMEYRLFVLVATGLALAIAAVGWILGRRLDEWIAKRKRASQARRAEET